MKPRSRIEQHFCDLANTMPPYSRSHEVIDWAKENAFPSISYYWKHRWSSEIWCQCCGHREPCEDSLLVMQAAGYTCPKCGAKTSVEPYNRINPSTNLGRYVTVFDVVDGVQVLRAFEVFRENTGNSETWYGIAELYQCWINDNGREVITTRRYSRSPYHFGWDYSALYSIGHHNSGGSGYYSYDDVYTPGENYIFPKMKFAKYFRNVRLTKRTVMSLMKTNRSDITQTLAYVLNEPYLESLKKTGYENLYLHLLRTRKKFSDYRASVNICHRNCYHIPNPDLWLDYIDNLRELGLDTHNAHYVCPANLLEAHKQMLARVERKRSKIEFENRMSDIAKEEPQYKQMRQAFFGLCISGNGFNVVCIKSVKEVFYEAKALHHCMFTNSYYKKQDSLLLSARSSDTGEPIESLEVSLRDFSILQCRGDHNKETDYHKQIVEVVSQHLPDIRALATQKRVSNF